MKKFLLAFSYLLLVCLTPLAGAPVMELEVDFSNPSWKSLIKPAWGKYPRVEGNELVFGPGSFSGMPIVPIAPGSVIHVEFDVQNTHITHGGKEGWKTAAVQMAFFSGNKEVGHTDLYNSGKPTNGKKHVTYSIPCKNTGFRLAFGSYGRDGEFRISNIKIKVEVPGKDLERDGSFFGMFGINDWFIHREKSDWDKLPLGGKNNIRVVKNIFPSRGGTLEIKDGGTVVSQIFPYNGEGLIVGAWYAQKNIKRKAGAPPWANAGIQLVYLDEKGKYLGHRDITASLLEGDRPWEYHQWVYAPGTLSRRVKGIQLWLRIWGGNTGTAWFDDFSVIIQGKSEARNYNSKAGTLKLSVAENAPQLPKIWNGIDLANARQTDHYRVYDAIARLKREGGIEYLRLREFMAAPISAKGVRPDGSIVHDFGKVDHYLDRLVFDLDLKLVPTIQTVPPFLQEKGQPHIPKDYGIWKKCVKGLVHHWIARYGKERVSEWIFECWNEPGSDFFKGTDAQFCRIFVTYLQALTEVEKEAGIKLRIGTPSCAMRELLSLCMAEAQKAGLDKAVTDASTHIYGGYAGSLALFPEGIKKLRRQMAPHSGKDIPVHITEYSGSAMATPHHDSQVGAASFVKINRMMLDMGVTRSYYYSVIDQPYLNLDRHYTGDHGMFMHYGPVPKAVFNALVCLNKLSGKRMTVTASSEPFDAIAAVADDGTVRVVVTTFSEEETDLIKKVPVTLEIDWKKDEMPHIAEIIYVDSARGNGYVAFLKAGKPKFKENPDTSAYFRAAEMKTEKLPACRIGNGKLTVTVEMELNSISYITLK
ncbi:MAG: hypothetical protein IJZ19_12200 [Lentisphaeria bacterium]|nr:hypothetical protein [Lentisphaeria bacterium]